MKLRLFAILFVSLFFFSTFACTSTQKSSRRPVAKISVLAGKKTIFTGDTVAVKVEVKLKNGKLKNTELYLNNELVKTTDQLSFIHSLGNVENVGRQNLKVVARKIDGTEGTGFAYFEVLSDIIPPIFSYEIIKSYPHNTNHFTQGLEIHDEVFYEGTGEYGKSGLYKFDLATGMVLCSVLLDDEYFGEGITIMNDKIYQLTYREQKGFIYDLNTFGVVGTFTWETPEGWGLTNDGQFLIKTDGSEFLHFIDVSTMEVVKKLPVYDNLGPVKFINELEFYEGFIYANVWGTNYVVRIDPQTGKVVAKIDFDGLLSVMYNPDKAIDVFNGIAINKKDGKFYVTGKLWPSVFEVKIIDKKR